MSYTYYAKMKPEDKIYIAYFESKKQNLYFNEIKELSKLSDSSLSRMLKKLVKNNILSQEKTKSNTFYKAKDKKLFAIKFSEIAMGKFNNLNLNIKTPLKNFLKDLPPNIYTIVLFGSASKKEEQKESDIDLLVILESKISLSKNKKEAEITSKHPISIFQANLQQFIENKDDVIIQARKTGFPIYKEQNFYEVILDGY
jgi:predicted nucleotidyltransferase